MQSLDLYQIMLTDYLGVIMVVEGRIGYLREVKRERIGRIYPKDGVKAHGYKVEVKINKKQGS